MDNNPEFIKKINKIYKKATYLDKYGGSVIATVVTLFIFFIIFSYFHIKNRIKPIKLDWINQRCSPDVMIFAGMINAPPGVSKVEFTATNFTYCVTNVLSQIMGVFTLPITTVTNWMASFFGVLLKSLQAVRQLFARIRTTLSKIVETIMQRIFNVLIQLQINIMNIKDSLAKMQGVFVGSLYTTLTAYMAMKSFMGILVNAIIVGLVIGAAIIIGLWLIPFVGWAAAIPATAFYLIVLSALLPIIIWVAKILSISTSNSPPNAPACFSANTELELLNGEKKKIKEIKLGEILKDGGVVTALFKTTAKGQILYKLDDIIVTHNHLIYLKNKGWREVKNHPKSIKIENFNEDFVYCVNTTTKRININNYEFLDWDEVDELDLVKLKNLYPLIFNNSKETEKIHKYLESGFNKNSEITLICGEIKTLDKIKIGDILKSGDKILGTVLIDGKNIAIKEYTFSNKKFIGAVNNKLVDNPLGNLTRIFISADKYCYDEKLYHFITDSHYITINGLRFFDYNGGLEQIIWNNQKQIQNPRNDKKNIGSFI